MRDAEPTLTACACGGTSFRVDTTVPVVFYMENAELSLELNSVYRSDLTTLVIQCQGCHASMDVSGLRDEHGGPVDPRARPALDAALSDLVEQLQCSWTMTEVTTVF